MNINLTKKSKKELLNQHNGTGVVFVHTRDNEYIKFNFWLGANGKFYTGASLTVEMSEFLEDLKHEIEVEKNE